MHGWYEIFKPPLHFDDQEDSNIDNEWHFFFKMRKDDPLMGNIIPFG